MLNYITFDTRLGWILLAESRVGIALVDFIGPGRPSREEGAEAVLREYPDESVEGHDSGLLGQARKYILEYFHERRPLPDVAIDLRKGTPFDQSVWKAIGAIPFGETRSYAEIARAVGRPGAFRAAGRACGRNPVPLFIPCHRVVASGGKLGGFSAGLDKKRVLLDLEKS
jgi:methylated-DNA-[protein]-cysteine S-methyltransferase